MKEDYLKRIAEALERAYPKPPNSSFFTKGNAFVWKSELNTFEIIKDFSGVNLSMLKGMDEEKEKVLINTIALADNRFANNILLWGSYCCVTQRIGYLSQLPDILFLLIDLPSYFL